jgi:preprotein translocase subunit SecY
MGPNPNEELKREVRRLVPTASILGGLALGCICVTSDVFGVIGGGQGMLVTTNIIYKGYELWLKEQGAFFRRTLSAE